jgi:hypothetical protein
MSMRRRSLRIGSVVLLGSIAACAPRQAPPPPAPPIFSPPQRPAQPPPPPPAAEDWRDRTLTPGSWSYRSDGTISTASFNGGGGSFALSCDRARRQVTVSRSGMATGNVMTIRTSSTARNLPVSVQGEPAALVSTLSANDRFLDAIAFSRGRFTVEVPGTLMLVIPAWPEPARVVEDCRF